MSAPVPRGSRRFSPVSRANLPKPPAVLQEKARQILVAPGCDESPRDGVYEFEPDEDYLVVARRGAAGRRGTWQEFRRRGERRADPVRVDRGRRSLPRLAQRTPGPRRQADRGALRTGADRPSLTWYIASPHVMTAHEIFVFQSHLAWSLQRFGLAYVFYLAIEPYARKLWPRMLTAWVRRFDNRFDDPLVGRDLLFGVALGAGIASFSWLVVGITEWSGLGTIEIDIGSWALESLRGPSGLVIALAGTTTHVLREFFMMPVVILFLRLLLRRDLSTLFRLGLLAFVVTNVVYGLLLKIPLTFDPTVWRAAPAWTALGALLIVAAWGFRAALTGRPVFRDGVLGA